MLSLLLAAAFSVSCPQLQCSFDASSSSGAVSYRWDWGNGRPAEIRTAPTNKNTYATQGVYKVTLTVTDASGATASVAKWIVVPSLTDGSVPPPSVGRVDTIVVQSPPLPPVHDTVTVQLPAPPAIHDTITVHDSSYTGIPPGVTIEDPLGEMGIRFGTAYLGRLVMQPDGQWQAVRYTQQVSMKVQGVYASPVEAIVALLNKPHPGFIP
jgi:PKD repeat protein